MDPIASLSVNLREDLCKMCLKALELSQSKLGLKQGVYYIDLKREFMPMLNSWKSTHEDPTSVAGLNHITFEALLVYLYTAQNAFYANSDFS